MVVNLSRFAQAVELDLAEFAGTQPRELFSQNRFPKVRTDVPYTLTVGPHGHYWLLLETAKTDVDADGVKREVPVLQGVEAYADLLSNQGARPVAKRRAAGVPADLPLVSFQGAHDPADGGAPGRAGFGGAPDASRLLWVDVAFTEGIAGNVRAAAANPAGRSGRSPPLRRADQHHRHAARRAAPCATPARTKRFQRALLALVAGRKRLRDGTHGELAGCVRPRAAQGAWKPRQGRALPRARRRAKQHVRRLQQRVFPQALPQGRGRRKPRHRTLALPHGKGRFRQRPALRRADRVPSRRERSAGAGAGDATELGRQRGRRLDPDHRRRHPVFRACHGGAHRPGGSASHGFRASAGKRLSSGIARPSRKSSAAFTPAGRNSSAAARARCTWRSPVRPRRRTRPWPPSRSRCCTSVRCCNPSAR